MELKATNQDVGSAQDEREWELADEDLDRLLMIPKLGPCTCSCQPSGPTCSTSRPCSCSRCMCR
jgi:hypothetical protein